MADEIYIRLDEITDKASVPQLKYWCKLLDITPKVISRAGHVTGKEADKLRKMADLIKSGMRPKDAANKLTDELMIRSSDVKQEDTEALHNRIESLEKAVMLLVKTVNKQDKRLENIQYQLEPPKRKVKEVKPWEPPKKASPDFHPLKKLWFELFDPAQLRSSH
jgi:dsDNA-specific endonuclease/ATPase MutS2